MKNYIRYLLLVTLLVLVPFKVFASTVSDVFINKENKLSFTEVEGYNTYQVYIKEGETQIVSFRHNSSNDITEKIMTACEENLEVCPEGYVGNYTLEIVALDEENEYALVEDTRTIKTISFKHQEFNGEEYNHVDVVGNETKYTITLDPNDGVQEPQNMNNLVFGQYVQFGSYESYGYVRQPKIQYYGWQFGDLYVTHDMTVQYEWEPLFTMSFNFNGGTLNGEGTFTKDCVGYAPSLSLGNIMSAFGEENDVIAPSHKELDYIKINEVRHDVDPEDGFMLNQDTEIVYYWKWLEGTTVHTVTFTDGFDNPLSTVEVADGEVVSRPNNPVMGRLIFSCWEIEGDCYNFNTPVTSDLTIEAYWNFNWRVEANVNNAAIFTYNGIDYPNSIGSAGSYHENEIVGIDQREINGYALKEWRLDSLDGPIIGSDPSSDYYIANGGHLKIKQSPESSNHVFYAIYEHTKVAVNFVTNGGTPIETQYVLPGDYVVRPDVHASTKEGYLLGKWYTDQALTQEYNFNTPVQTELTLYASWDIYLPEVRGTVNKPVDGFTADTNIVSADSSKYTFDFQYWYLTTAPYPHIEGNQTFEKDNEYEIRYRVVPKPGYAVDYDTEFYLNDEETTSFGSSEDRQIRWIATDPIKVNEFDVTGIVKPVVGNKPNNNISLNTQGLQIDEVFWTEESSGDRLNSSDKFANGKRYILHIVFNTTYGYVLNEGFNEDVMVGPSGYLKAEYINNFDVFEMQIYYEATQIEAPVVKISSSNNKVTLTWNEQVGVTKAEVYRSLDNKKFTKLETINTNSYQDKSLTYGKKYYYKVRVYGNGKWTSYSNVVNKTIKPNKVNNLRITGIGSNNIKLAWDKVSVTGYEIHRSTDNKEWTKVKDITDSNTLVFNNKDLKANKKYYYKVKAYKKVSGKKVYGSWSEVVNAKTTPAKPDLELILKDYNKYNIKFSESKGATYYIIGADFVETFDSEYQEMIVNTVEEIKVTGEYTGLTIYARIKACNKDDKCSGWNKASLKITPKAPKLTVESTKTKKVTVTVGSVNGADGYKVYRSTSKNGTYELIKELTKDDELIFNNSTKKGVTYYYKVKAYRMAESKKVYSPYSKIKSVKSK